MGLISRVSSRTYRSEKVERMQIFIKNENTTCLEVDPATTVKELKINGKLVLNCRVITDDSQTLAELDVQDETTFQVTGALLGGGKKRKKKVYTTPKKIKHKRTKVKMATLKYYKVDDTGKIERKRKECPADICGPGIFMSNHKDRQYCGKCSLT